MATLEPDYVRKILAVANSADTTVPEGFVPAAVLVPLVKTASGIGVVLIKRRDDLAVHAGEYSFPGGHVEPDDKSFLYTALRETEEEIGVKRSQIDVLGMLNPCITLTRFFIVPFVGWINEPYNFVPQPQEVAEVVVFALNDLLNSDAWKPVAIKVDEEFVKIAGKLEVHEVVIEGRRIWGATARILRNFLKLTTGVDPASK